mgnify:CR=1 FL=1
MRNADNLAACFGELDFVDGGGSADVRRKDVVDIARDVQVCAEQAFEILVVDEVLQVGFGDGECELVERHIHAEILRLHVELDMDSQVAAICELEVDSDVGVLVAEVDGRNGDRKVLQMNLGADFQVFVDDVTLFERDIFDGDAESVQGFGGIEIEGLGGVGACFGALGGLGRSFFSPEDKGIYMSILLRPDIPLERAVLITSMHPCTVCAG